MIKISNFNRAKYKDNPLPTTHNIQHHTINYQLTTNNYQLTTINYHGQSNP